MNNWSLENSLRDLRDALLDRARDAARECRRRRCGRNAGSCDYCSRCVRRTREVDDPVTLHVLDVLQRELPLHLLLLRLEALEAEDGGLHAVAADIVAVHLCDAQA